MRSSHLRLITAEYELLKKSTIKDAIVLRKVKLLSSDRALQQFWAQAIPAVADGTQEFDALNSSAEDV